MNILLVGGSCSLINSMILKLRKEGHRIFLLTGDKYRHNKYERVFEKYEFSYDCENLNDILESVNADVTILMGAFDTNYRWDGEEREIVLFISHLVNILVAYSVKNKKRLIFLSSDEIYNGNYTEDIKEEDPFSGVGIRADALSQAEEICDNFRINRSLDIITLRLDHLYNIPKERKDVNNICADMCLNCMCDGHIKAKTDHTFSLLYENDAVEYIYQFIKTSNHKYSLYNLSSNDVVSEVKLAAMIQKAMEIESNIVTFSDSNGRCVLSGNRFEREFGVHAFGNLEKNIKDMVSYMKKHESVFLKGDDLKLSWWKMLYEKWKWLIRTLFPFFENLVCFVPFFMMNNRTVGSEYFANLDPFLLYVLLFAIVYGQQQATFSAILAVAGYMFRQMYTRSSFEVLIDYNTYVWIAQLFILGLVVGYMRDQIRIIRLESQELEEHLHRQIVDIRDINESNVRVKGVMEQQLIDHKDSIGKIYSITAGLEQHMPDEVIFYAVEMLGKLMKTKDVALYNVVSKDYARIFSASSQKARSLGNSIRYREMTDIYDALKEQKVYINKKMDEQYPLMARGIYEGEEVQMIVMMWGLSWEKMTLGQANFLTVVSYLIQNAVLRAQRYMQALEEKRYSQNSRILEPEAFESLVQAYMKAKLKNLVECVLIKVDVQNSEYQKTDEQMSGYMRDSEDMERIFDETHNADVANALAILEANEHTIYDPPAVFDSNKSEILLSTENKLKEIYEVFPNEGKVVLGYSYLVSWNYVTWLDFPRPIDEELIPLFKKWIRKFPENKLELMEYYSFILFEKWLYMDSLDNISEANKIYYEIKAIADELSKDYADNQVTQMLSMGIVRKL